MVQQAGNAENYLQEAVSAIQDIDRKEGPGEILVFLTSPVETERTCEKLGKIESDPNLVAFPFTGSFVGMNKEEFLRIPLASAK